MRPCPQLMVAQPCVLQWLCTDSVEGWSRIFWTYLLPETLRSLRTRGPCHCLWDMRTIAFVSVSPRVLVTWSLGPTHLLAIVGLFGWWHVHLDVPHSRTSG